MITSTFDFYQVLLWLGHLMIFCRSFFHLKKKKKKKHLFPLQQTELTLNNWFLDPALWTSYIELQKHGWLVLCLSDYLSVDFSCNFPAQRFPGIIWVVHWFGLGTLSFTFPTIGWNVFSPWLHIHARHLPNFRLKKKSTKGENKCHKTFAVFDFNGKGNL